MCFWVQTIFSNIILKSSLKSPKILLPVSVNFSSTQNAKKKESNYFAHTSFHLIKTLFIIIEKEEEGKGNRQRMLQHMYGGQKTTSRSYFFLAFHLYDTVSLVSTMLHNPGLLAHQLPVNSPFSSFYLAVGVLYWDHRSVPHLVFLHRFKGSKSSHQA